ncbi:MAG: uracil-DNA glycosylase [Nitrospirae bacterium]|nr:MAG: uracil-DNA glycosylase [Nitrospirota bacterium]
METLGFDKLPLEVPETVCNDEFCLLKEAALKQVLQEIGDCKRCRLSLERTNIVFGEGDADADLMFIGEAPGADEDKQGRPFVGRAGQLLTRLINKMGFKREEVYIANTVKCRPPGNRKPSADEIFTCNPFLKKQISIIKPIVIMTLGDVATKTILGDVGNISRVRGKKFDYEGITVVPTFHPSYLLRNASKKWDTWNDAQLVLKILEEAKRNI